MTVTETATYGKMRIISVVAATIISLACGTNYAYSAWAPQFADRLQLSATQINVIGTSANLGMYASGIPMGIITDRKSPRLAGLIGVVALFVGYYPVHLAYQGGPGSMSVPLISFCSFVSGIGSCAAFQGALKTATLNWPTHRGTASAFPLAAFGLSAFFYTLIAGIVFPGDTSALLMLLSFGTSLLVLVALPFLHVVDHKSGTGYAVIPTNERSRRDSNLLHRTKPTPSGSMPQVELNRDAQDDDMSDTSSLMSGPGDLEPTNDKASTKTNYSHSPDVTGIALLCNLGFWQLWVLMGLLAGIGLMTINNIGHDVQALWNYWDDTANKEFIAHRQLWHVSIISICSFLGRLLSGIGSDVIVKRLQMSRFWCAAVSATVFMLAQMFAIRIEDPTHLWAVSSLCGLAYGILFGVFPALVVDAFGPDGFAVNWGFMTLSPVVSGNIFNIFYGSVYDAHSKVQLSGERNCGEGLICYQSAYYVTLAASVLGILVCLWGIKHEHEVKKRTEEEHERHRDA